MKAESKVSYRLKKDLIWRKLNNEIAIVKPDVSEYYSLNNTAAEIWELTKRGENLDNIIKKIAVKYEIDENRAREDISKFVNKCLKEKLIEKKI